MTSNSDLIARGEWPTVDYIVIGAGPPDAPSRRVSRNRAPT